MNELKCTECGETLTEDMTECPRCGCPVEKKIVEKAEKSREETRILYVAMTRAIRSFSWIELEGKNALSWQNLISKEG